jgi:response regulator RpfG family c-di-GMP phosphodiesterase
MSATITNTVHVPLSRYTLEQLHTKATELRSMAARAWTTADMQALERLAARLVSLAERREAEDLEALRTAETLAMRIAEAMSHPVPEHEAYQITGPHSLPPCPDGMLPPFPAAWRMACELMGQKYADPATLYHPVMISACFRLACDLVAYGKVPAQPPTPQVAMVDQSPAAANADTASNRTSHHILLVDDAADVLVSIGAFLVNAGFTVRKTANGDEALRIIASDPRIDALVTDFAMPALSGAELIVQATQIRPNLKALIITGYPNADGLAELPPDISVLVKPFRRDVLINKVKSLFGETPASPNEAASSPEAEPGQCRRG